jgi:hypothetical protein
MCSCLCHYAFFTNCKLIKYGVSETAIAKRKLHKLLNIATKQVAKLHFYVNAKVEKTLLSN